MPNRRRAREVVVQILFQEDLNSGANPDWEDTFLRSRLRELCPFVEFAQRLLTGVRNHRPLIDRAIQDVAHNWRLSRMAATDRGILRLAAFELLFCRDTPQRVVLNEAIELAKRYGTDNSSQFVNGILDQLLKSVQQPIDALNPVEANPTLAPDNLTNE